MGLSNARRALVVDSNPWNRRQICDVLAKKGYEVSACDSLSEGRKFYRAHPIVVAGSNEEAVELADFVSFVRQSAGVAGGYVIRLNSETEAGGIEASDLLDVDDRIGPELDPEVLEVKFQQADDWLAQREGASVEEPVEIISNGSTGAVNPMKTQVSKQAVKTETNTETNTETKADPSIEAETDFEIEIDLADDPSKTGEVSGSAEGEMPDVNDASNLSGEDESAVSIRRGKALRRVEGSSDLKSKEGSMPEKTTKYQYNLLIENAPLAMAMFDEEMHYLIANGLWRKHFDLEEGEVVGRRHFDIFSEVSDRWQGLCDRARSESREVVGEELVEWPDGATDWVRWTMRPWENKAGETGGLVVSCGVITGEKTDRGDQPFEAGLAESLMKSGVTPLVVLDFNGRVVRCNRIAKRWGDWGETSGDDRYFWDAFAPADSRQAVHESFHGYAVSMEEDGEFTFPPVSIEAVRNEGGEARLVAWTNTPRVGEGGVITGLVRVGVEIRDEDLPSIATPADSGLDEEQVGELQDEWMDSFPLMCWRTNSRGKIKFFNRQWLDFRGRDALEECDNGWMDGLHEEDYDSLIHAFDTAAKTGARVNHVARMLGGDGQYRWLRFISARDFSDLEGASDGFVGYCEDLGRIIRLESELSAAKSRYDELLEDSTGAFRAKRGLEERIAELDGNLAAETLRLADEREAAVALVGEDLAKAEADREKAVLDLDEVSGRLERERADALASLETEKEAQFAKVLEGKTTELEGKAAELAEKLQAGEAELAEKLRVGEIELAEKLGSRETELEKAEADLAGREVSVVAKLEAAEAEMARVRESSKSEIEQLEKALDEAGVQNAQGLATLKADFETAAAEKELLTAEVASEKGRQKERDSELLNVRKEMDAAHKEAAAAGAERDRFVTMPKFAPYGLVLIARDGAILYSNPATDEIVGVDFGQFETVEDWLKQQAPDGDEEAQARLLALWRNGVWRQEGTKVLSMQTDKGLRELELKSKLLPEGQVLLSILDMTDSLRSEEALRASEVKFRSIFYDSGVGMTLVDKTGNIFDANPAQEKLLGYSRAELRKMHIEDCLSLEEIARTQLLAKEMAEKRSRSGEMTIRLQPKDKHPAWAHMNVSLVRDPDGEVIFAAYFFHDITKERQALSNEARATSSLESTQAEKRAIVEASPDLIVVVDPDGVVENIVPPVSFPLHVDHSMEGRAIGEVIPSMAEDFAQLAVAARESGGVETREFSVDQGGETFHFECRIAPSGDRKSVIVIRDVSAAKRADEVRRRQALTFANSRDAIIVSDLKGRINDWNPAAEQMFGYTREEAIGKGLYMLYDPVEPKRFKQTITASIGRDRKWEGSTPFQRKDGSGGVCDVRYTPLLDENGRPLALVGVSRLAQPAEEPETAVEVPAQGGSATGHEAHESLRQSVRALADMMALQAASDSFPDELRAEFGVNRARIEAVSLLQETIEEGGDFETVDFGQYVRNLVQYLLGEFGPEHAGIEVHLNVKGIMLPVSVAHPLAMILFELMSNSLRHAFVRSTSGMVGVSMGLGEDAGWLVVNDDGTGLPDGFDLAAPPQGAGLKIAAEQARQIQGEIQLVNAADAEIQVGFRLIGAR